MHEKSFGDFEVYTTLAAAEAGVLATGDSVKAVRCGAVGTLRVAKSGGATVDLPFAEGETQYVHIRGVSAAGSTGCVPITVYR